MPDLINTLQFFYPNRLVFQRPAESRHAWELGEGEERDSMVVPAVSRGETTASGAYLKLEMTQDQDLLERAVDHYMRTTSNTEHRTILNDPEGKQNVLLQLGTFRPYLPILERMSDGAKAKARSLGVGEGGRTFTDLMLTEKIIAACHVLVAEGENRKLKLEISELQRLQKELEEKARTDSLTGILNRRGFDEVLGRAIAHTKRKDWQDPLQLLFLDLDHFKRVNDESGLGHPAGDQVLREVANRLVAGGREEDVVGRLGGEEFGILLYTNAIKGRQAAIRYLQHIRAGEYVVGMGKNRTRIKQTVSIGGTSLQINDTPAEFVARADRSMYLAKNGAGRGRDQVWYDREYVPEAV